MGGAAAILLLAVYLLSPEKQAEEEVPSVTNAETSTRPGSADSKADTEVRSAGQEGVTPQNLTEAESADKASTTNLVLQEDPIKNSGDRAKAVFPEKELPSSAPQSEIAVAGNIAPDREAPADEAFPVNKIDPNSENGKITPEAALAGIAEEDPQMEDALAESQAKEELLGEQGEDDEAIERIDSSKRWSVGPSLAPVFFSSFGNGSPISQNFVANSKSGTVNMSYGLNLSYEVTKKLSIRTGIHKVDYGYNTGEVAFTSSLSASPGSLIRTISYSENSKTLVVQSAANNDAPLDAAATDVAGPSPAREGNMLQEFGYLELPLEMQYTLIDKKWGLNLIGGMSSLFLINNRVSLESGGAATEIGEATNMNEVNFSTNFGLGIYYNLSPSMRLNMQPIFKYQLNTFSETAGNFNPYSIGVYSGINFKF